MDITALFKLSYGLYIIGAKDGERNVGCVVNTVTQSTSKPVTLTVCINKDNYTNSCIQKTKAFSVSILSEKTKESTFGIFGFRSSRDTDKFAGLPFALSPSKLPYLNEGVTGYLQCRVIDSVDNFTHTVFIAEVEEAENLFAETPMTYAYYHNVIKGKAPKNASTFVEEIDKPAGESAASQPAEVYVCSICRYEYPGSRKEFEKLPDDYICPICKAPKSKFVLK